MRTLVLSLALLGACDAATEAPEADASLASKSVAARLNALEAESAALKKQLAAAQATIATLQTGLADVDLRQRDTDFRLGNIAHQVQDSFATGHTLRGEVDALNGAVFDTDAATGARVSKIDALTIKQKVTENAVGQMRDMMYTADANGVPQFALVSLEMFESALGGPGRQGGHLTVMEDYALALAGGAPLPPDATPEDLRAALFQIDPETGAEVPGVDGAGVALAHRMRKRPELLYQAWDDTLREYVADIVTNPLYDHTDPESNPLFDIHHRVAAVEDGLAAEAEARFIADGEIGITVKHHTPRLDALDRVTWADQDAGELFAATRLAHFVDDWQGETAYLRVEDKLIWTHSQDQAKRIDVLDGTVVKLDARVTDVDKRMQAGDATVAAAATKEVKELADILKADYGKQIGGVQTEVDALWAEMVAADDALQKQIDLIAGETCRVGDLAEAVAIGDWRVVDECLAAENDQLCGTTDHL